MPELATATLPRRRPELIIAPAGEVGCYVVKDPRAGSYFHIEEEEHFLLSQLDGNQGAEMISAAFAHRFGKGLAPEELAQFLEVAQLQGFLVSDQATAASAAKAAGAADGGSTATAPKARCRPRRVTWQSILSWRINLFDPDRCFGWVEPKIRLFWTRGFLAASAGSILLAIAVVFSNQQELASSFVQALRWETVVLAWLVVFLITTAHEFAHGLTCKHYGGEVREVGFFMLLLAPCSYCNVSDAWMFREKSKRLWVMFAGAWFELFVWSLGVFAWRLTQPGTVLHYLAFVLLSSSGLATLFNFNPLIKLDGYYMLSDWLEIPNLHGRGHAYFKGQLRRLLWGAPKPEEERRGTALLGFGLVSWLYTVAFLALMLWGLGGVLARRWGWLGAIGAVLLGCLAVRGLFRGFGRHTQPPADSPPGVGGHGWVYTGLRSIGKFLMKRVLRYVRTGVSGSRGGPSWNPNAGGCPE